MSDTEKDCTRALDEEAGGADGDVDDRNIPAKNSMCVWKGDSGRCLKCVRMEK